MTDTASASTPPPVALPPGSPSHCQNCGTELLGPHCYACGQPIKGTVRHFGSLIGDFLDTVFEYDNRLWRTLVPLLLKPGHISNDYLAGRRVRYVSPFRLFFFVTVLAFFVAQFAFEVGGGNGNGPVKVGTGSGIAVEDGTQRISEATTVAEVEQRRDALLAKLDQRLAEIPEGPAAIGARIGIEAGKAAVQEQAGERIAALRAAEAEGRPVPEAKPDKPEIRFGGDQPWNAQTNPVRIGWLPPAGNDWINRQIGRAEKNIARIQEDPELLKEAVLGSLPATFFVLLPIFALLLKLAYLFKRRLYMEHLIVALHSHAFLSLALLLISLLSLLGSWSGWRVFGWGEGLLLAWMPIYLLLAQKRVYQQGWFMTLLKFGVLGFIYFNLLSIGVVLTLLASLVWL